MSKSMKIGKITVMSWTATSALITAPIAASRALSEVVVA